jgi:hypothetical protein
MSISAHGPEMIRPTRVQLRMSMAMPEPVLPSDHSVARPLVHTKYVSAHYAPAFL